MQTDLKRPRLRLIASQGKLTGAGPVTTTPKAMAVLACVARIERLMGEIGEERAAVLLGM